MRLRLILSFALIVLVAVVSVVLIARQSAASEVRSFMFRGGMVDLDGLVNALEEHYHLNGSWEGVDALLVSVLPGRGRGKGQAGQGAGGGTGLAAQQRLRLADADGLLVADTSLETASGQMDSQELDAAIMIEVDGRTAGYLSLESGTGFTYSDQQLLTSRITRAALIAGLIAGGMSLLLALLLAYRLMHPVRALTQAADQLGQGDLSQRVAVRGDDELAMLGRTFNHMAESLEEAEESRRAMTADIAHELRNPLAVQRANLEALQDGIYPLTVENLAPILAQNLLLTRLVEDLRTLALADAGQLNLERTPTDLVGLVERVVERFKFQAAARQVDLVIEHHPYAGRLPRISVDPMRVEQILSNLLSNALRYTPDGGQVRLRISQSEQGVSLSVHDSGAGVPGEALPQVFERFYRADKSRSRAEGGTGLGLAIARQLAQAHGGNLTVANHPHGGAIFTLTLPLIE